MLGRCRRSVLLCDAGEPRNSRSRWVSGFLTRDGVKPGELRQAARQELAAYPSVELRAIEVTGASQHEAGFETTLAGGERVLSRKLILAPGLCNDVPDFPGSREFFGRGVYPCPYCDGWEHRDQPLAAFGDAETARGMALELTTWTSDIVVLTHGQDEMPAAHRRDLDRLGIEVIEDRIAGLEGDPNGDGLERIRFATGRSLARRGIFYAFEGCRQSPLVEQLGCDMSDIGAVQTGHFETTNVPGLFVAGDASRRVKFAIVAAAEGAMAAFAVNTELLKEDLARSRSEREAA
jgi:thioredoxin reductase